MLKEHGGVNRDAFLCNRDTPQGKLRSWTRLVQPQLSEAVMPSDALSTPHAFPVDSSGGQPLDFTDPSTFSRTHAVDFVTAVHRVRLIRQFPFLADGHFDDEGRHYSTIFQDPRLAFVAMQDVRHQLGSAQIGIVQTHDILNLHYPGISLPPSRTGYAIGQITALLAEDIRDKESSVVIGEVGVGSGIIMASTLRNFTGDGISYIGGDVDGCCLHIAEMSMRINGFNSDDYRLKRGSLLEPFRGQQLNIIVSNPPYFPSSWSSQNIGIGPNLALDGGTDGLDFYRAILDQAPRVLAPHGKILLQVSNVNLQEVRALAERKFKGDARVSVFRQGGKQILQPTNKGKAVLVEL